MCIPSCVWRAFVVPGEFLKQNMVEILRLQRRTSIGRVYVLDSLFTPHTQWEWCICDWGWCPFVCDPKKSLNGTLAVDVPFQTIAVDFSSNL